MKWNYFENMEFSSANQQAVVILKLYHKIVGDKTNQNLYSYVCHDQILLINVNNRKMKRYQSYACFILICMKSKWSVEMIATVKKFVKIIYIMTTSNCFKLKWLSAVSITGVLDSHKWLHMKILWSIHVRYSLLIETVESQQIVHNQYCFQTLFAIRSTNNIWRTMCVSQGSNYFFIDSCDWTKRKKFRSNEIRTFVIKEYTCFRFNFYNKTSSRIRMEIEPS